MMVSIDVDLHTVSITVERNKIYLEVENDHMVVLELPPEIATELGRALIAASKEVK